MEYINACIFGLPRPKRLGNNTSKFNRLGIEYIHRVEIHGSVYYKVRIKRQDKSKIKYFKNLKSALIYRDMLRINRYM